MKNLISFMTLALISITAIALVAVPVKGDNDPRTPFIQTVSPDNVKQGSVIRAEGSYLDKALVSDIYLTRGSTDIKLEITNQTSGEIVAKLPAQVEPGRYRLMVLTVGLAPRFIEQPVLLTVE